MSVEPDGGDRVAVVQTQFRPVFPLRRGKVQRPLLPDDTIRRDRLLNWMAAKVRCRIIYIVAEAGFGKTTLVADFARRSRIRTFWYRLDEDDTDGLAFLRYLIASCRAVEPRLLSQTAALLEEVTINPVTLESVLGTFLTEYEHLGDTPSMLVLDDYYLAEHVASVRSTVERLIARAPANLTFVFATRRTPDLSVAVLRARSALAEMGKEELRFEHDETGQLFMAAYNRPLEADVLDDVQARTDGWAASLQLVKTAVEGRTPAQIRAFVRSMSGAEGHLYDYLAQEVVGDLAPDLRDYLLRSSILEDIETETSAEVLEISEPVTRRLIAEAQRIGLLSRAEGIGGSWRAHPLVREFLLARLEDQVGEAGIVDLHRHAAAVFEPISWRLAVRHWAAANSAPEVRRVLSAAVPTVIATGDIGVAEEFMTEFPDPNPNPWYDILKTRGLMARCRFDEARELMEQPVAENACSHRELVLARAICQLTLGLVLPDDQLHDRAARLLLESGDAELRAIAEASIVHMRACESGSLDEYRSCLEVAVRISRAQGHTRFLGISSLDLAEVEFWQGEVTRSTQTARRSLESLQQKGDYGDALSAGFTLARGLAHAGDLTLLRAMTRATMDLPQPDMDPEWICEAVEIAACYDQTDPAVLARLKQHRDEQAYATAPRLRLASARVALAEGDLDAADHFLRLIEGRANQACFRLHHEAIALLVRSLRADVGPSWLEDVDRLVDAAAKQQAWFWWKTGTLMRSLGVGGYPIPTCADTLENQDAAYLSVVAELVVLRLDRLGTRGWQLAQDEAARRPDRWRRPLRRLLSLPRLANDALVRRAVALLEVIGTADDVGLLRRIAKSRSHDVPTAGRELTRRLAPRAYVEDLGRLSIRIGDRPVSGGDIRRKVLSLLGFLLTRAQYSATREQIQDALWPDLDPEAAANSLNQTSYFLRRVFEAKYTEKTTAGYLVSKADLIWLDSELVTSRSFECQSLLAQLRREDKPEIVARLAATYTARFATDFLYDDWSCAYRDHLHAAFLDRVERSIRDDLRIGAFERGIALAQQSLMADPEAEEIELLLLQLYLATGAQGAAAEQYAHYASVMREQLGVEPPALADLWPLE